MNDIVGFYRAGGLARPALWRKVAAAWTLTDLGVLGDPHVSCMAIDLNDSGTVIGECPGPTGISPAMFVWEKGRMRSVNELLTPDDAARMNVTGVYDTTTRERSWRPCGSKARAPSRQSSSRSDAGDLRAADGDSSSSPPGVPGNP